MGWPGMSDTAQDHYAYGAEHADVEAVIRFPAVKRWHMIDTTRTQTLAEHSASVALLVYAIAKKTDEFFGNPEVTATRALLHDLGEVFVGDIPSHTKKQISGIEELENSLLPTIFNPTRVNREQLLIKLCDLADGIRFIRLHGIDMTATHAMEGLTAQLGRKTNDMIDQGWPADVRNIVWDIIQKYAYDL